MASVNPHDDADRFAYLAEGNATQSRKRVAVKLLIRDKRGRVLLVNPTYKDYWDIPGGMAEANEAPTVTGQRELTEELAYTPTIGRLLHVEWVDAHGPWDDQLVLTFDGGLLSDDDITRLRIADDEISEFGFFDLHQAARLLRYDIAYQLSTAYRALDTNSTSYHERSTTPHQRQ